METEFSSFEELGKGCEVYQQPHLYKPDLLLILVTDDSAYSVSGQEHPLAFASKIINDHEKQYSRIEEEALAIVFDI